MGIFQASYSRWSSLIRFTDFRPAAIPLEGDLLPEWQCAESSPASGAAF